MMLPPMDQAGAQNSQSPMVAKTRAVMKSSCRSARWADGQNCSFTKI